MNSRLTHFIILKDLRQLKQKESVAIEMLTCRAALMEAAPIGSHPIKIVILEYGATGFSDRSRRIGSGS